MKTLKSSLLLPLLTILFSLALNGCYTQLAFVDDEQYASIDPVPPIIIIEPVDPPPPIIIIEPINPRPPIHPIDPIIVPRPIVHPSPPIIHQLPTSGSSPIVTKPPTPNPPRGSGYQRPDHSENTPISTVSNPDRRPGSPGRGGR